MGLTFGGIKKINNFHMILSYWLAKTPLKLNIDIKRYQGYLKDPIC